MKTKINIPNLTLLNKHLFNDWIFDILDNYSNRYEIYYGGSGSGKSYAAISKLVLKASCNKRKVLIVRKFQSTIKHSIYSLVKEILSSFLPQVSIKFIEHKSDLYICLGNGSEFIFKGLDDAEKLKSINGITDIIIEEATEISFNDFTQLDLRLRPAALYPQIYVLFNPVSKLNWCYTHWFANNNLDNTLIVKSNYKNNKFLTKDYINMLENLIKSNSAYYRIYALGEFASIDKLIFNNYSKLPIDLSLVSHLPKFVGLDFGFVNDPTAIVWGHLSDTTIYITGEYVRHGMLNVDIANTIISLGLAEHTIVADSSEIKSIEDIKRLGIRKIRPATKGPGSVVRDISRLLSYHIIVDDKLSFITNEFENYSWAKHGDEYINTPIDKFNHAIDALRYGVSHLLNQQNIIKFLK